MLSKVTKRVRQTSVVQLEPTTPVFRVDIAPDLLRWSDFSTPFPSVSIGGYSRFYTTRTIQEEPLNLCPLLSQYPEPSPSSEIPPISPLFSTLRRRCPPVIPEVSLESLTLAKPRNLTISTITTPPHSLKRRRRQMFRTPSAEGDSVHGRCQSPSDTITISAGASSTDIVLSPHSTASSSSDDSQLSHDRSDSSHSEFPITPSTSIDSEWDTQKFLTGLVSNKPSSHHESKSAMIRPINSTSFCTAETGFSEI
ncbi:hypothetical protein BYT27DRAFT_7340877 [Phlegmacium glaucopus]|nr:hypothetical protein BYT27DRAFT_7340877 [Phlegmacium glaucopus]